MSEVNERWERDHSRTQRLTVAGIAASAILWTVSYFAATAGSWGAGASFVQVWFGSASAAIFLGAVGTSIGSGIGIALLIKDDKPLAGSNR